MVERRPVKALVVGSNPTSRARRFQVRDRISVEVH